MELGASMLLCLDQRNGNWRCGDTRVTMVMQEMRDKAEWKSVVMSVESLEGLSHFIAGHFNHYPL